MLDMNDVRAVIGPDDLQRVGEFRYRIYIGEQGKTAAHADHAARTLIEPADRRPTSTIFWIERDGAIKGTVRAEVLAPGHEDARHLSLDALDFIAPSKIVYFTRMMVARDARKSDVMPKLCLVGFQKGVVKDCWIGVLTCKRALVPLFETYGYSQYADSFVHPESGAQTPMAIVGEIDYLGNRAAPLTQWLSRYRADSPYSRHFLDHLKNFRASSSVQTRTRQARALIA